MWHYLETLWEDFKEIDFLRIEEKQAFPRIKSMSHDFAVMMFKILLLALTNLKNNPLE